LSAEIEITAGSIEQGVVVSLRVAKAHRGRIALDVDLGQMGLARGVRVGGNLHGLRALSIEQRETRWEIPAGRRLAGLQPRLAGAANDHPAVLHLHHAAPGALTVAEVLDELGLQHDVLGASGRQGDGDAIELLSLGAPPDPGTVGRL
jgi:hypothetical protein